MPRNTANFVPRMVAALICTLFCAMATSATAGPWINPGDETLRQHLHVLADAGVITVPITTWPLMWSGIQHDIENSNNTKLSSGQLLSLHYVRFAYRRDTKSGLRLTWRGDLRQNASPFTDFGDSQRDEFETSLSADWLGETFASRIKANYSDDTQHDPKARLDGSYIAAVIGNWSLAAGAIDRWWGPGWQNTLILGTNARPVPGFSLQRNHSSAPETSWLQWIGPWHLETFMGQLESDRNVEKALLWGIRATFRPFKQLEIGAVRTAQWGGKGRPQDFSTFTDLLIGRDNRGDDGVDINNEPGNQLGGVDWRLSTTVFEDTGIGFYGQLIGEDESGALPSRYTTLFGLDTSVISTNLHQRFYLEFSDTTAEGFKGSKNDRPNYAYEHGIYRSGYRYRGRSIGATTDNDSRMLTLAHNLFVGDDQQFSWSVSRVELNRDGTDLSDRGGNTLSRNKQTNLWLADARYSILFNPWQLTFGLDYQSEDLTYAEQTIGGAGAYFAWEVRW